MSDALEFTPELLKQHAQSMRALAQHLLHDADAAEDVLQDTWMTLLKRPLRAAPGSSLGRWLHAMVGNLARNKRRGKLRSERREQSCARPESSLQLERSSEARGRVIRGVTEAVMALDEPYRSVVLLRFFEDLPPRDIALQHGISVSTVKSRLQRALTKLRCELARSMDDDGKPWQQQLGLALGLSIGPGTGMGPWVKPGTALATGSAGLAGTTIPLGALLLKLKLLGLAASVLLVGVYIVQSGKLQQPNWIPSAKQEQSAISKGEQSLANPGALSKPVRSEVEQTESNAQGRAELAKAALAQRGLSYRISGTVVDRNDRPLPHVELVLGPSGHPLNRVGRTDEQGNFSLAWTSQTSAMELLIGVGSSNTLGLQLQRLQLSAGHTQTLRLCTEASAMFSVQIDSGSGDGSLGGPISLVLGRLNLAEQGEFADQLPECEFDEQGLLCFVALPVAEVNRDCPFQQATLAQDVESLSGVLRARDALIGLGAFSEFSPINHGPMGAFSAFSPIIHGSTTPGAQSGRIEGSVYNEAGQALEQALVTLDSGEEARTDASGRYVFEDVAPGSIALFAGGGNRGQARTQLTLKPGATEVFDAFLERGLELRLRLLDAELRPLAQREVLLSSRHPDGLSAPWEDRASTDEAGYLAIPNCPRGALALYIYPSHDGSALPIQVFENRSAQHHAEGPGELSSYPSLCVLEEELGSLRFELTNQQGRPLGARCYARLSQVNSGLFLEAPLSRGTSFEPSKPDAEGLGVEALASVVHFTQLPPGSYRLEILGGPHGYLDYGQVYISAGVENYLGSLRLFEPARLVVHIDEASQRETLSEAELRLHQTDGGLSLGAGQIRPTHLAPNVLAKGHYRLEGSLKGTRSSVELVLEKGQALSLHLGLGEDGIEYRVAPHDGSVVPIPQLDSAALDASCAACHAK